MKITLKRTISNKLKKGDIIFAVRAFGPFPYLHYGVYVGEKKVIHFATEDFDDDDVDHAKIIQTSLEDFAHGDDVYIEKEREGAKSDIDTVRCAKAYLGTGLNSYNLFTNNCEHFANMCKYGEKVSHQISRILYLSLPIPLPITLVGHYVYNNIIKPDDSQKVFISKLEVLV